MHMSGTRNPVRDATGTLSPKNSGTTSCAGVIGQARHFEPGQGIAGGEDITGLPSGLGPHTTEAWFRAEQSNTTVVGWGNEQAQGKVVMEVRSPPHVTMDCYFSGENVASDGRLPMGVGARRPLPASAAIRGSISTAAGRRQSRQGSPLNIRNPARMWIGGWYDNYRFVGDMDEVRILRSPVRPTGCGWSTRTRSRCKRWLARWSGRQDVCRLAAEIAIDEGQSATFTAQAGGAEKVYWILKRDGRRRTSPWTLRLHARRRPRRGRQPCILRFKAIYPDGVKTRDIPVTIKETIPEPDFTLARPAEWNGRDTIEVVPDIRNLEAMKAAGAGSCITRWTVSGGAGDQAIAPGPADPQALAVHRSDHRQGGDRQRRGGDRRIDTDPGDRAEKRSLGAADPEKDEKPEDNQFYARDDKNEGTLYYNGQLDQAADAVF